MHCKTVTYRHQVLVSPANPKSPQMDGKRVSGPSAIWHYERRPSDSRLTLRVTEYDARGAVLKPPPVNFNKVLHRPVELTPLSGRLNLADSQGRGQLFSYNEAGVLTNVIQRRDFGASPVPVPALVTV